MVEASGTVDREAIQNELLALAQSYIDKLGDIKQVHADDAKEYYVHQAFEDG